MSPILTNIANTIVDVARSEDLLLRRVGQGIFFVPELAFVHAVGRAIASKALEIFGTTEVKWMPETALKAGVRTDLVFEVREQPTYAFEFKCGGKGEAYVADIKKLAALPVERYERVFCALIDAWPENISTDPRIRAVENSGVPVHRLVEHFDFFSPLNARYKKQVSCVVGIWRVGSADAVPTV